MPSSRTPKPARILAGIITASLFAAQPVWAAPSQLNFPNPAPGGGARLFLSDGQAANYGKQSQLAGIPIKAGIGNIANPQHTSGSVLDAMWQGLKSGATSLGFDLLGRQAGLDPFTQALSTNLITGAISGAFKYQGNIFQGVADSLNHSILNFSTLGTGPQDPSAPYNPVQQVIYLSKVNDFSNIIRERGLKTALETYATSIFQRDAVESIWKLGGVADFLTGKAKAVNLDDGRRATEITFTPDSKLYLNTANDSILGRAYFDPSRGLVQEFTSLSAVNKGFGYDETGRFGLVNGKVLVTKPNGLIEEYTVTGGNIALIEGRDAATGKTRYFVSPSEGSSTIRVSPDGTFIDGKVVDLSDDYHFSLVDGNVTRDISLRPVYTFTQGQLTGGNLQAEGFSQLSPAKLQALAKAIEDQVAPIYTPSAEDKAKAQQQLPQFLAKIKEDLTQNVGAQDAEAMTKEVGKTLQTLINNPDALAAEQARLQQEQTQLTVGKEQASTFLSRALQKGIKYLEDQGDSVSSQGHWVAGGLLYTLAAVTDIGADPLRIGVGVQQAKQDVAQGHYGAAAFHVLQDGLRAVQFIPVFGLAAKGLGRSLEVASAVGRGGEEVAASSTSLSRIGSSLQNFFRIGEKVYDEGKGALTLARGDAWVFESQAGKISGAVERLGAAEEVTVYRVIPRNAVDPTKFSSAAGRFNEGESVFYTSFDKDTAIREAIQRKVSGYEADVYEMKILKQNVLKLNELPIENQAVTQGLGDTAHAAGKLDGIITPSAINPSAQNYVVFKPELIGNTNKLFSIEKTGDDTWRILSDVTQ